MASYSPILGNPKPQYEDSLGVPYVGMRLFFYIAGTATKQDTVTDSDGLTTNTNPIVIGADGYPENNVMIYGVNNTGYKVVAAPPGTDDPPTSPLWTIDNVYPGSTISAEWINPQAAIYASGTTFTVIGDQTTTFKRGTLLKLTGGADRYAEVVSSAYTTLTTVIVRETNDGADPVVYTTLHASNDTVFVNTLSKHTVDSFAIQKELTLQIPTDYATLLEALTYVQSRNIAANVKIIINYETGYTITEGTLITHGGEFSNVWITSTDAEVLCTGIWGATEDYFRQDRGIAPRLECLINMQTLGQDGYRIEYGVGNVGFGSGVKNAGRYGIRFANGSVGMIYGAIATGAGTIGVMANRSCVLQAREVDCSDSVTGLFVAEGSICNALNITVDNCTARGIIANNNSHINCASAVSIDSNEVGIICTQNSSVNCESGVITNSVTEGIWCYRNSKVHAKGATITGSGTSDVKIEEGSQVNLTGATTTAGAPAIADTNVDAFNVLTGEGVVFDAATTTPPYLEKIQTLSVATDADTLTSEGWWYTQQTTNPNFPDTNRYFIRVLQHALTTDVIQIAYRRDTGVPSRRVYTGAWSAWTLV